MLLLRFTEPPSAPASKGAYLSDLICSPSCVNVFVYDERVGFREELGEHSKLQQAYQAHTSLAGTLSTSQSPTLVVGDIMCPLDLGLSQPSIYKITVQPLICFIKI